VHPADLALELFISHVRAAGGWAWGA
jgi:hypothetical protein